MGSSLEQTIAMGSTPPFERPFLAYVEILHSFNTKEGLQEQLTMRLPGVKVYGKYIREEDCLRYPPFTCYYMLVQTPTRVPWRELSEDPKLGSTNIDEEKFHTPMVAYSTLPEDDDIREWVREIVIGLNKLAGLVENFGDISDFQQYLSEK
jgi:hypothetical protein